MTFILGPIRRLLLLWRNRLKKLWLKPTVRFLIYLVLGAWTLLADPFTLSSSSDRTLSREYHNLYVRFSGVAPPPLTVVMIDSESIRNLHNKGAGWMSSNDWPLNYSDHSRIIRDLTVGQAHTPAILFYDIFFEAPREVSGDLRRLGSLISRINHADNGISLVIAGGGLSMSMLAPAYKQLKQPLLSPTAWSGLGDLYPLQAPVVLPEPATSVVNLPTPAVLSYLALCEAAQRDCDWLDQEKAPEIAIHWAIAKGDKCVPEQIGSHLKLLIDRTVVSLLQGLTSSIKDKAISPECLPLHKVRLAELYDDSGTSLVPPGVKPGEPYGVMVGVVMASTQDYIATPVYENLAGVFLHAMAFENLWRLESRYFYFSNIAAWGLIAWGVAAAFFMRQAQHRDYRDPRKLSRMLFWWFLIAMLVVILQLVFHGLLRIVPEGWLSLVAIVPLLREVVLRNEMNIRYQQGESK